MLASTEFHGDILPSRWSELKDLNICAETPPSAALKCSFYSSIGCLNGGKQRGKHAGQLKKRARLCWENKWKRASLI